MKISSVFALAAAIVVFGMCHPVQARRYGRGGYGAGSTIAGSFLMGAGMFASGMGQFNLATSQGANNYQQAYSKYLDNLKKREQTYFEMRKMNASYRAEMELQRPHPTPEQIVEFNKSRLPSPLGIDQWNPAQNIFHWPQVLARNEFVADRKTIEDLFMARVNDPYHTGLGSQNSHDIEQAVEAVNDRLHAKIDQYSADEYLSGSKFLQRLSYAARSDASAPAAVAATK